MSNQVNVCLLRLPDLLARRVGGAPLLDWARDQLARGNWQDAADEILWNNDPPGVLFAVQFPMTWPVAEDLERRLCPGLPPGPLPERLVKGPPEDGADFPPDLGNSPLRALNIPGWQFLHRHEMAALAAAYGQVDPGSLRYPDEWDILFEEHAGADYDLALFVYIV